MLFIRLFVVVVFINLLCIRPFVVKFTLAFDFCVSVGEFNMLWKWNQSNQMCVSCFLFVCTISTLNILIRLFGFVFIQSSFCAHRIFCVNMMCFSLFLQELSARVKFTDVVKRLEKIATTKVNKTKGEIVSKFFKSIIDLQQKFHDECGPDAVSLWHCIPTCTWHWNWQFYSWLSFLGCQFLPVSSTFCAA